ncbi:MAG: hypothetical protein SGPRY_011685 [Prymnesium sp.]
MLQERSEDAAPWCSSPAWSLSGLMSDLCGIAVAIVTLCEDASLRLTSTPPPSQSLRWSKADTYLAYHIFSCSSQVCKCSKQLPPPQYLSWGAPVFVIISQLAFCLLVVALSAIQLPQIHQLRRAKEWLLHELNTLWKGGPFVHKTVRVLKSSVRTAKASSQRKPFSTERSKLLQHTGV